MSDLNSYFRFKCDKGFIARGLKGKPEYKARLKHEMETIEKMGFPGYFIIVADFLAWARSRDIPVGPGRGSAAGSLVAYCLGITNIDPLPLGLLFERFMNPDRISMPDIDCDFCEKRRDEVIEYVTNKYGKEQVAQIGTFGTMKAKGAIKDVARTLGLPLVTADKLSKLIPPPEHGKAVPLAKAIETVPQLSVYAAQKGTDESEILKWALRLENTVRSYGIHASGVVISPVPLTTLLPLALGKEGNQATQLEMNAVESVGLIKFDFLGLRTLTMMKLCCQLIKTHHGVDIDLDTLPLDDEKVYENLRQGDTCGIFQLETSSGMRDLMVKVIPRTIEDIIALVAMFRPGPLGSKGMQMYLDVRAGKRQPSYPFPEIASILKPTAGWIIYQEQVMQIARALCAYTPGLADDLRKAIGKKKEEEMKKHRVLFCNGAATQGHDAAKVTELYDGIEKFGAYGFNKSHAACYGVIAYQTAWLKAHYPVEFMCAALTCDYGNVDKVIKYINECRKIGIKILPPDVNKSRSDFTIDVPTQKGKGSKGEIRFGLSAIKNLGEEPVSQIVGVREKGFSNIIDFCDRVDTGKINRKKVESLIGSGAFDTTGHTRSSLLSTMDRIWDYKEERKKYDAKLLTFEKKLEAFKQRNADILAAELAGKKKLNKLKEPEKPVLPKVPEIITLPEMGEDELLTTEKDLLGFYISGHPLDAYASAIDTGNTTSIDDLTSVPDGQFVLIPGIISSLQEKVTKKGDIMAFARFEDKTGQVDLVIFGPTYLKKKHILQTGKPLMLKGKVEITRGGSEDDDEGPTSAKVIAMNIEELVSGEIRQEPIDVIIKPEHAKELVELLSKYPGNSCDVNIFMKALDNSMFKVVAAYSIGGSKNGFLRDLGRLIS